MKQLLVLVEPMQPVLEESGVGDDYINVTLTPGDYDKSQERPVGNGMYVKYRKAGDDKWQTVKPEGWFFLMKFQKLLHRSKHFLALASQIIKINE